MRNVISERIRRLRQDPRNLFYLISAAGIILYFLFSFHYGGRLYTWMAQENAPGIRFLDYFSHLSLAADPSHLYDHVNWDAGGSYAAVFPPLAYAMYYLLYRLTAIQGGQPPELETENIPGALSVFTLYLIFNAVLFFLAIEITGQKNRRRDLLLFSLLMLSAVFAGSGYMLGNSAMLVVALLIIAIQLKDSSSAFQRETGLLILAVCVAMKLYPAVFGLLFLKEKKYRELFRLIIYSLLLLILPFGFFGGLGGIRAWIHNLTGPLHSSGVYGRPQFLKGLFFSLIKMLTGREAMTLSTGLSLAVCLLWAWMAWRSECKSRTLFFLVCIMVFFPSGAYRYTLAYFAIPLITMMKENPERKSETWSTGLISTLYGLLFTIPVWWLGVLPIDWHFFVDTLTSVEVYLYLVAYVLTAVVSVVEWRDRGRKKTHLLKGGTKL